MAHLFAYGTLRHPEVWTAVVGKTFPTTPAVLTGYTARCVRNEEYPGLVAAPGERVKGIVYTDLSHAELNTLDRFEGNEYQRIPVRVQYQNGEELEVMTYLFRPQFHYRLEERVWDYDRFLRIGGLRFLH